MSQSLFKVGMAVRSLLPGLSASLILLLIHAPVSAAPRVDNVLIRMAPPGVTSLVGARMDRLMASDLYRKLIAREKLPQLDAFAQETGFDPRRDVREVLLATGPQGAVLLTRGKFNVKQDIVPGMKLVRHGQYEIREFPGSGIPSGFCILDSTLAAAGDVSAVEASLDEWTGGTHTAAQPLLRTVASLNAQTPLWGVSTGFAAFLATNLPRGGNGIDFSAIFKGIESTWFSATVTSGFHGDIHCIAASEKDAMALRDTAKGLIGLGRLNVPENKPNLLRFWDGITVEQTGRAFTLIADVPGDLIDEMIQLFPIPGGRGRGAASGGSGRAGPIRGGR